MGVNCIMANEITTPMEPAGRVLPLFRGEYSDSIVYENPDMVLYENSSYVAKQITIGNPPPKNASSNDYWQMIAKGIIDADISESTVEFTEASERSNIKNGEKTNIIMGKIMKFFADLKDVAFSGSYVDLSNKPTIPASAKNGKLTIQKNGIEVQTFTANQSTNAVANILVPTISNSAAVTQTGQMALDAVEKNAAVPGTLAHQVQQVNSNINKYYISEMKSPENTGFQTLLGYVMSLHSNGVRHAIFSSVDFSDLPAQNWGFSIELVSVNGAVNVRAYKHLSADEYYFRAMGTEGNWISDWRKFVYQ